MPKVQIAFKFVLYTNSLLSTDKTEFLPSSQCRFLFLMSWFLSLRSRRIPRYFTELLCGSMCSPSLPGGHIPCLRLNVTWVDFEGFICYFLNHLSMSSRLIWSFSEAISGSLWLAKTAVSSA